MTIIDCDESHGAAILAILNDAIVNSTAVYDYHPRPPEAMVSWFETKRRHGFPILGAIGDHGALMGFATYGTFRAWPAYKYTVEHSLYIDREHRRRGLGRALLGELIERANRQNYHALVGGIDATNAASITLHERLGFAHAGTIRQAGYKHRRWLDLAFYQLLLDTPARPMDDPAPE